MRKLARAWGYWYLFNRGREDGLLAGIARAVLAERLSR